MQDKYRELKQKLIGLTFMNNRFLTDTDFEEEYEKLHQDEKDELEEELKRNI